MTPTQAQRGAATSHLKRIFQACHRSGSLCEPSKGQLMYARDCSGVRAGVQ